MTRDEILQAIEMAAPLVRRFEGLRLSPYLCPAGYPTIGYGNRYYLNGVEVRLTDAPITRATAEIMMRDTLRRLAPQVLRACPALDTPARLAAILDFTFNLGVGQLHASTLRKRINAGNWEGVKVELKKWVYAAGRAMNGLKARRAAEVALI